jgi:hypothetical protein
MSDAKSPYIQKRDTPQWSLFQRDLFWKLNEGEVPQFNTRSFLFSPMHFLPHLILTNTASQIPTNSKN